MWHLTSNEFTNKNIRIRLSVEENNNSSKSFHAFIVSNFLTILLDVFNAGDMKYHETTGLKYSQPRSSLGLTRSL